MSDRAVGLDQLDVRIPYVASEVGRGSNPSYVVLTLATTRSEAQSKAYGIIERFSEDIDLLVVCEHTATPLKRLLRKIADRASEDLGVASGREHEGRGFLNARYSYVARRSVGFLSPGVLLEMGSRGGPWPSERLPVRSLMSRMAGDTDPAAVDDYSDLGVFQVMALAPERTLAEKLAFLHHRASVADHTALRNGARHLYDAAMLVRSVRVNEALADGQIAELMADIDERSAAAGWPFTPRPEGGFATSNAFGGDDAVTEALRDGYASLADLVWGELPTFDEAIDIVRGGADLLRGRRTTDSVASAIPLPAGPPSAPPRR